MPRKPPAAFFAALLLSCLVVATAAAQAQASSRSSSAIPANLRALVIKFGSDCSKVNKLGCEGPPAQASKTRRYDRVLLEAAPVCNQLRPSKSDGKLGYVWITDDKLYSRLTCYWGGSPLDPQVAAVGLTLPKPGKSFPKPSCATDFNNPTYSCFSVAGGVRVIEPWSSSNFVGLITSTTKGVVAVTRRTKTEGTFYAHRSSDYGMFERLIASLSLMKAGK